MRYNGDQIFIISKFAFDHQSYQIVLGELVHRFKMINVHIELIVYIFVNSLNIDILFAFLEDEEEEEEEE